VRLARLGLLGEAGRDRRKPNVALEIERRFLVSNGDWKNNIAQSVCIRDGLIGGSNEEKVRVRIANGVATIALKSCRRNLIVRDEFEYVIPLSDAEEMLRTMCDINVIDKIRYFIFHSSNIWHVDVYEGILDGVVLAEVELASLEETFILPDWIGDEVTGDPRYSKINMVAARLAKTTQDSVTR
jgi:CYTH domain-containing protein